MEVGKTVHPGYLPSRILLGPGIAAPTTHRLKFESAKSCRLWLSALGEMSIFPYSRDCFIHSEVYPRSESRAARTSHRWLDMPRRLTLTACIFVELILSFFRSYRSVCRTGSCPHVKQRGPCGRHNSDHDSIGLSTVFSDEAMQKTLVGLRNFTLSECIYRV